MATAKRNLYLNADRTQVVSEGPDAAYVLVAQGGEIREAELGEDLMKQVRKINKPDETAEVDEAETKEVEAPPENKAQRASSNKGR